MAKKKWVSYIEYFPIILLWKIFITMPFSLIVFFCQLDSFFLFKLLKNYRRVSEINLSIALPNKTQKECSQITKKSIFFFLLTVFELIQSVNLNPKKIKKKCVFLKETLKIINNFSTKKGILICSGHYSSFYWILFFLQFTTKRKVNMVLRGLDNPLIHKKMKKNFLSNGIEIIERGNSFKKITGKLNNKEVVLLLTDQNSSKGKLYVPFFNKLASTMTGAYYLQQETNCQCYFMNCRRDKNLNLNFFIEKISNQKNIEKFFLNLNQKLEKIIQEKPEEYFWLHPRWKKQKSKKEFPYGNLKV